MQSIRIWQSAEFEMGEKIEYDDILTNKNKILEQPNLYLIKQYVCDVLDFSSQYGSDISISYTAYNIIGKPSKFPNYGDFPQTFVLRTYGNWWNEAPSRQTEYMPQNEQEVIGEDYIDLVFEHSVYPFQIYIYETYNPGAVVRIWCASDKGVWIPLWEKAPMKTSPAAREFCPDINPTNFPTNWIRLEFNQSLLNYHTEIDAVMLVGTLRPVPSLHDNFNNCPLSKRLLSLGITATESPKQPRLDPKYLDYLFNESKKRMEEESNSPPSGSFSVLPDETIIKILSYLDILSLSRCALVNKRFYDVATDSLLYTSISLQPYWYRVNRNTLKSFSNRCRYLQKLDLSWCGVQDKISPNDFSQFIRNCGAHMTHLKLNCCRFINNQCLKDISRYCFRLKELCLRNCNTASEIGFNSLSLLTELERLDLYRATIEGPSLINILRSNTNIKHLSVGACGHIAAMDDVAYALSVNNPNIISVDFWKSYSLSPLGLHALANCHQIEELDIGWCLGVGIPADCLLHFAKNCSNVRKLVLAALRGLTDFDVLSVLNYCTKLEQLDLLGLQGITSVACEKALQICKNLRLLDISFCEQISDEHVSIWRQQYPYVAIKRSFQADRHDELQPFV